MSAVPVVRVRSAGERTEGLGEGSLVRYGFCDRAASRAPKDSGLVIKVISEIQVRESVPAKC